MKFLKDQDQATLIEAEMVTIIGTGNNKHLPEGVELVEEKGMAELLISKGHAVLKEEPAPEEPVVEEPKKPEPPVIPAEPIIEQAPVVEEVAELETKEEPATGNVADDTKNLKEKKGGKK